MGNYSTNEAANKGWAPLSLEEREEISIGLETGRSLTQIARELGRNKSTISREVRRNGAPIRNCRYRANRAQKRADERQRESHFRERLADERIRKYVLEKLGLDWTPERIAGRLPIDHSGLHISAETIYQWIYADRRDLIKHLVFGHKRRQKRAKAHNSRIGKVPNRTDISRRPASVETRKRVGHWEADTVVSRQSKEAVAVFVERKTRFFIAIKLKRKTAEEMRRAAFIALSIFPKSLLKTITFDNGLENALHEEIDALLGTKSYFCKPYHSWEKGSIENRNGILRRYFPKKHDWALTKKGDLNKIVSRINSMPMKCLGYKTPYEVLSRYYGVALAG
jgi:IS30 family transposase